MSDALAAHHESKRNIAHKRLSDAVLCARKALIDPALLPRFETWCERLESIIETFNEAHVNLISELKKLKADSIRIDNETIYQEQADEMYAEVLETKRKIMPQTSGPTKLEETSSQTARKPKLPPIKLPCFTGELKDFPGYIDLFNTMVHQRTDLSDVEKFQYLVASLSGESVNIIRAFPVSGANYNNAYEALVSRYSNKRYLAFVCWEQLIHSKPMQAGSAHNLRDLLDIYNENLSMLKSLGLPIANWDFVLFHSLVTKLDKGSREAFELSTKGDDIPKFEELKSFLLDRCNALERSSLSKLPNASVSNQPNSQNKQVIRSTQPSVLKPRPTMLLAQTQLTSSNTGLCILCKQNHGIFICPKFISKSPQDRFEFIKQHKLCANCLRANHSLAHCKSTRTCKECQKRHNTLLHFPTRKSSNDTNQDTTPLPKAAVSQAHQLTTSTDQDMIVPTTSLSTTTLNNASTSSFILLATAELTIKDHHGTYQKVRGLLDPGSQSHIITESCVRRLGLTPHRANIPMSGIAETLTRANSKVFLEICPVGQTQPSFSTEAIILEKICGNMPTHSIDTKQMIHLANLKLADERYHMSRPIDILIGGEIFPQILLPGKIDGSEVSASAINTIFGWILMGKTATKSTEAPPLAVHHLTSTANLDDAIQRFWAIDHVTPIKREPSSTDDILCEEIYQNTHKRDSTGRYIVHLPFRDHEPIFHDSYSVALNRFYQLEKRLSKNPTFSKEYDEHIQDYISNGQMESVPLEECHSPTAYYIPHHAITKPTSLTTKMRVVYDASAKDTKGVSLNDTLLIGAKLQADITNILLRFRLHANVLTADIRQMYRRIIVTKNHRDYQRILYRTSPDHPVQEFRLNRVTFGVSSAPFLAIRTMHQLAEDEKTSFPIAADILLNDLYVDDIVTGCQTLEQALEIQAQMNGIMAAGGFELRKWASNRSEILDNIPEEHRAAPDLTFDSDSHFVKILGLAWNSYHDHFNYQVNQISRDCTKRTMLSDLARIYDPIGLLTPLTFLAKFLIQRLWLLGTAWDDPVPDDIYQIWNKFTQQLHKLSELRIPRRITHDDALGYQIHGFCDASEAGYAAVVYFRSINNNNQCRVTLVSAKSRVAPVKRMTLPRLELCAASLLADLLHYVITIYSNTINIQSVHAWSDSMIVLSWIKTSSSNFKVFVGNRISNIHRKIPTAVWRHIPGKQNPADCASRGLTPDELVNYPSWWVGPPWFNLEEAYWPKEPVQPDTCYEEYTKQEERAQILANIVVTDPIDDLLNKCSSVRKIQRILTYVKRFINSTRGIKSDNHLSEPELHEALLVLIKYVQKSSFKEEMQKLKSGKILPKSFRKLNPFLDKSNVLRVGGRLSHSDLEFEARHPALLPRKHRLTQLIIQAVHNENFHPGLQTLHYLLLQNFWILSPKRAIRYIISNCYRCFRAKPVALQPEMADLPRARITQVKAFQTVGCDYAGPFNITPYRRRGARTTKAYICLFVCFATKALHLELASDLSSITFLAALRRFIGRRGRCNMIHSDCGTNFKGAERELNSFMNKACEEERIQFKFNPPGAPHFGGLWEAGVKSVKTHLYRVIGTQILTYEEFNTLLVQVESILNSRPLCPISSDPNDLNVLTPGHFLTLAPLTTVPSSDYTQITLNRLKRWQLLQRMQQDFWARWHKEYLCSLTQRLKWTKPACDIKPGRMVIIKSDLTPPLRWQLGRIVKLFPGQDGIARVATVKTTHGTIDRPLVKLCPIPEGCD